MDEIGRGGGSKLERKNPSWQAGQGGPNLDGRHSQKKRGKDILAQERVQTEGPLWESGRGDQKGTGHKKSRGGKRLISRRHSEGTRSSTFLNDFRKQNADLSCLSGTVSLHALKWEKDKRGGKV